MIDCHWSALRNEKRKESKNRLTIDLVSMATGYDNKKEMRR